MTRGRTYPPLETRFWAKVDKTPGHGPWGNCWLWTGSLVSGYGQIARAKADGGRVEYAHRISFELANGVDLGLARETDFLVLHRCDFRACVNPDHLFTGDDKTNFADMVAKGRRVLGDQRGIANPQHKLSEDEVRAIRAAHGSLASIADRFGISSSWAWSIRANEAWAHLIQGERN